MSGGSSGAPQPTWEGTTLSRPLPDPEGSCGCRRPWWGGEKGRGSPQPSCALLNLTAFPPAPSIPTQLRLSPGSSTSLLASWADAGGAAWLHLVLRNLLMQTVTKTLSAKRGLTSYTFQHLHPGTQYWLGLSAVAGPYTVEGPNATAWTCE